MGAGLTVANAARVWRTGYWPWTSLYALPDMPGQDRTGTAVANAWYFPGAPPEAVQIPYSWLSPPIAHRPDRPFTTASVGRTNGSTARAFNAAARAEYGELDFSAELDSATDADPAALADYILQYYATQPGKVPRQRASTMRLRLNARTPSECAVILGVTEGRRITITGTPARWPEGATEQVVEGIHHIITAEPRDVEWVTAPVIGTAPGAPGPWFRVDSSFADGTDAIPF